MVKYVLLINSFSKRQEFNIILQLFIFYPFLNTVLTTLVSVFRIICYFTNNLIPLQFTNIKKNIFLYLRRSPLLFGEKKFKLTKHRKLLVFKVFNMRYVHRAH